MIDITHKQTSLRHATAAGIVFCDASTVEKIQTNTLPKGNLFDVARAAALLASKKTHELIPHCHPVSIDSMHIEFNILAGEQKGVLIEATGKSIGRTGIEMEVLTAVSVAALTIYDLLKPVSKDLEIGSIKLLEKIGGKSDPRFKPDPSLRISILVISDSTSRGERADKSGRAIEEIIKGFKLSVHSYEIVPDEPQRIRDAVSLRVKDSDFIFTTGGTGLSPTDQTPEALRSLIEKEIPGAAEAMRSYGQDRTPWAMLSRSFCGTIGKTVIVCLPGSTNGARESLQAILPGLFHSHDMLQAKGHS